MSEAVINTPEKSVYGTGPNDTTVRSHTLSILVDNQPGVLARVVGLYSGRGYNIESLTVAETDHSNSLSRITLICSGTPSVIEQIKNQLDRLVPVHRVTDLTLGGAHIGRELVLVKVRCSGEKRAEAARLAAEAGARRIDATQGVEIYELTDTPAAVDRFIAAMRGAGLEDHSRTGVAAISCGASII